MSGHFDDATDRGDSCFSCKHGIAQGESRLCSIDGIAVHQFGWCSLFTHAPPPTETKEEEPLQVGPFDV